jgi:prevent-host-death family protein
MDVGIRELKRRLSELVEQASRGRVIRITDRGKPKAVLGPIPGRFQLDRGIAEGWVKPGTGEPPQLDRQGFRSSISVEDLLAEDRGL